METQTTIAILTDFGTRDGYVGALKGVLRSLCSAAALVDISHDIAPQDVHSAASTLARCYHYYPAGTVFLIVVDPGVGTARRPIAVAAGGYRFVAPDNGVLTLVLREQPEWQAVSLTKERYWRETQSVTFHGRDIFAPVAAHWASGVELVELGEAIIDLVFLPPGEAVWQPERGSFLGEVRDVDHFGNLLTNIGPWERKGGQLHWQDGAAGPLRHEAAGLRVAIAGEILRGVRRTYGEVPVGDLLALINSEGYLEVAVHRGSATAALSVGRGTAVALWSGD